MMEFPTTFPDHNPIAWATFALIAATCVFSFLGFRDQRFEDRYIFCPGSILSGKEYFRLVTSGFLHANVPHLLFNMMSLYSFGTAIEFIYGPIQLLLIYFASIIGGDLLSLWLHRHHEYRAYGASGGVCGIIFAHIVLLPGGSIGAFFIPLSIPTWAYAILFLLGSFYALKASKDNVGHDAHIGGAIIGLLTATALHPEVIRYQPMLLASLLTISVGLFIYLFKNPLFLPIKSFVGSSSTRKQKPTSFRERTREVDRILEKISTHGLHSLKEEERQLLHSMSDKLKSRATSRGRESDLVI
jgi:membrane associated rhomboid family serine protease